MVGDRAGIKMLIGMLAVGQLNSQARPAEVSRLSATELSTLIETLTTRNRELRSGLADIREQLRQYEVSGPQSASALQVSREDLRRITAFGGMAAVDGQGIVMEVDGDLDAIAVNDLRVPAEKAGLKLTGPKRAFLVQGDDRVGAVADVARKLAEAKVNIIAAAAASGGGGRYGMVVWVPQADYEKAAKALGA